MPICPIYGLGVLMILIFFRPLKDTYLLLFAVSTVLCTAFEYFMGWFMEKVFHTRWWDYTHMKFNLHGYICLRNSLFFGSGCVVMYHFIEPAYENLVAKIPVNIGWGFIVVMLVLIALDTVASFIAAAKLRNRVRRLDEISRIMLTVSEKTGMKLADGTLAVKSSIDKAKDSAENIYDNVHEKAHDVKTKVTELNRENLERLRTEYDKLMTGDSFSNRLLTAFPRMVSNTHADMLYKLKNRLHIHRFSKAFTDLLRRHNKDFEPENEEYHDELIVLDFTDADSVPVSVTEYQHAESTVTR